MSYRLRAAEADLFDAEIVAGENIDADAVALHGFSGFGDAAEPFGDQPADGGGLELLLGVERLQEVDDAVEIEVAGDDVSALAVLHDVAFGLVLVADLAHDDFEQI